MEKIITIENLPLEIYIPRKRVKDRKFILNLNTYRNADRFFLGDCKNIYTDLVLDKVRGMSLSLPPPYTFKYIYYKGDNRKVDISNPLSIIDKFTCDALVKAGLMEDDNFSILTDVIYSFGGVEKCNGRVDLEIYA